MTDATGLKDVAKLIPSMPDTLRQVKQQERWKQAFAGTVLLGAAGLALWLGPTPAIVFASLATAAIFMFPGSRRKLIGDAIALRDASGTIRLAAAVGPNGQPVLALLDSAGNERAVLGLDATDQPLFMLTDAQGRPRMAAADTEGTVSMQFMHGDDAPMVLAAGDRGPYLQMQDPGREDARMMLTPNFAIFEAEIGSAAVSVSESLAKMEIRQDERTVTLTPLSDNGMLVQEILLR